MMINMHPTDIAPPAQGGRSVSLLQQGCVLCNGHRRCERALHGHVKRRLVRRVPLAEQLIQEAVVRLLESVRAASRGGMSRWHSQSQPIRQES